MDKMEIEGDAWVKFVERQPKNPTMDKKLCITVCPTGSPITRKENQNQPYTPQEIAREVIESYKEGACMAHVHVRDENGVAASRTDLLKETIDTILNECPDMIIQPTSYAGVDDLADPFPNEIESKTYYRYERTRPMVEKLRGLNPKYMQSTVIEPHSYTEPNFDGSLGIVLAIEENLVKMVEHLQENNVKPEFVSGSWECLVNVKEWLITPGILQKPYFITMGPGMHNSGYTYPDPWGILYVLSMMKIMPDDTVIGISAGGRNWLSLTTFAILMGIDVVRVGMEDHLWMYPHKDEKVKHSSDETRKIATIAKELGRDIATPDEARQILGMD